MPQEPPRVIFVIWKVLLLEGCLCFSPSPIYVLGFANPAINWWAFAMFAHALVFLGISACRFSAMAGIPPRGCWE